MVALVSTWHAHHGVTTREVEQRLERGDELILAGPALIESYAVLTRLPSPHRLAPPTAAALLELNFRSQDTVALEAEAYWELVASAADGEIAGGTIYDAVISECARTAGAESILTLNERHFAAFARDGLSVVVPSSE